MAITGNDAMVIIVSDNITSLATTIDDPWLVNWLPVRLPVRLPLWQWQWQWNDFIETQAYKDYALMHNYTVIIRKSDT